MLSDATKPRVETSRAVANVACICGGRWPAAVAQRIIANEIRLQELCRDVLSALVRGRSETMPVLVLAGATGCEGKSLFLKLLQRVFCDHNSRLPRIAFFATRDIEPFEELCYDYGYADVPGKTMPCLCGAKKCKKLLY